MVKVAKYADMLVFNSSRKIAANILLLALLAAPLQAFEEPDRSGLGQAEFRIAELTIENEYRQPWELPAQAMANAQADLAALGVRSDAAFVDRRGGRWATLLLSEPLLPGRGQGNGLSWANLGRGAPKNDSELGQAAGQAFRGYLEANSHPLRIDTAELAGPGKATVHGNGALVQIYVPRTIDGVPVRGSYLSATINHGNLTLFGAHQWGDVKASTSPGIARKAAFDAVQTHVGSHPVKGEWGKSELVLVPLAQGLNPKQVAVGNGFDYRLAWVIRPAFDGESGRFEALVDAQTGQLLSFEDTNHYAEVVGGVYPVTNDGIVPDGVEQAEWPMPYADTSAGTTDTGGNVNAAGTVTTDFYGPYVNIDDQCGASSLSGSGLLDWGISGGTDCSTPTPNPGGAGNTHSSRTGFYELNKVIEMARGQLPNNTWLQQRLTSYMNRTDGYCPGNAWWNGTVNFCRSSASYSNTGEIAGVFDHEWGHGMDANDATPGIASPSGEGIADIYTALRLNDSCIGRNFRRSGTCSTCQTCTGVRDIDYAKKTGSPSTFTWANSNCGSSVHCKGHVYSEAVWSLWKRKLPVMYGYDDNTAHEIVNRLTFLAAGATGTWYSGSPPNGGCAAGSGYMNYLAADDDDGNINNGTPHMQAIYEAFNDQEIACQTPAPTDSGCAGTPTSAPSVTVIPVDTGASLTWSTVADASGYEVFRTEGVFQCAFGKVKLGETSETSWEDSGLQNGRDYSYIVIPKGGADACFGPASACATVMPAAGPNLRIDPDSVQLSFSTGDDGDEFVDNGEIVTVTFDVKNIGSDPLDSVMVSSVSVVSPTGTQIAGIPTDVDPSTLGPGDIGLGSFSLTAAGLQFGDALILEVSLTSDAISKMQTLTIENTQTDIQCLASKTWEFEANLDGWKVVQGTFNQASSGGGAGGSSGYVASSANLDNQCDRVRSPAFSLRSGSTLSLHSNFDIEPESSGTWWDRANVSVIKADGARTVIEPDSGRSYNADSSGPGNYSGCNDNELGWAGLAADWAESGWSATALDSAALAGQDVQVEIGYATDVALANRGFWFDQVTVTNADVMVPDGQPGTCGEPQPGISLTKTGTLNDDDGTSGISAGDTITYALTVTNTGGVPLTGVRVGDPGIEVLGGPIDLPVGSTNSDAFTAEYTLTQADVDTGTFTNTATATSSEGASAEDSDTQTLARNPALTLEKASTQATYAAVGEVIDYQFGLTNSGNTTLHAPFVVSDDLTSDESCTEAPASLLPGESTDCTASYTITQGDLDAGSVTNIATASAQDPDGATVNSNADSITVTAPATQVRVAAVVTGTLSAGKGSKYGTADVTIVNNFGDPVEGALVTGDFGGSFNEIGVEGSTNASGVAPFQTSSSPKGGVSVSFCVSDVSITGLEYVPDEATSCGAAPSSCGNGSVDTGEDCDGSNLNGATCQSLGYESGVLSCTVSCTFETQSCVSPPPPSCGLSNDVCDVDGDCCSGKCRTNGAKAGTCT